MSVLDDKKRLGSNDYVSFRVVEDRDNESQHLRVNDNGELEVPYIGLVPAAGKTCKELAYNIKSAAREGILLSRHCHSRGRSGQRKIARTNLCLWIGQRPGTAGNSAG